MQGTTGLVCVSKLIEISSWLGEVEKPSQTDAAQEQNAKVNPKVVVPRVAAFVVINNVKAGAQNERG